ncbi:unnamed protein product [Cylicocyclus nassatus]|uniref:UDP-N-acetylglucosamine--dolichyl-phosphate N-acetylglucosaminephosphotransferase n=1 Tax=Cylicocyclus nassatus TaxID=53992 RepID=A0AA36DU96_CYLNA|nr:unnamed protein product [Cylicocyclus nassatus]
MWTAGNAYPSTIDLEKTAADSKIQYIIRVFNFLYSLPQLFKLVPCPRHRLPKFNPETNKVSLSMAEFKESDFKFLGNFTLKLFSAFGLLHSRSFDRDGTRQVLVIFLREMFDFLSK